MASIQKFEDLICWKKARELANFIYDITDKPEFKDFDLKRQIRRAVISPLSNIAEGFDGGTRNEFVDALFIAKGECGEVRSQLYIAHDRGYLGVSKYRNTDMSVLEKGLQLTDECSRLIQSFAYKVKGGSRQGIQFKHVPKPDYAKELLKENAPDIFARLYPDDK